MAKAMEEVKKLLVPAVSKPSPDRGHLLIYLKARNFGEKTDLGD
jgi:hypothetical protein